MPTWNTRRFRRAALIGLALPSVVLFIDVMWIVFFGFTPLVYITKDDVEFSVAPFKLARAVEIDESETTVFYRVLFFRLAVPR